MRKDNIVKLLGGMIERIQFKMKEIEENSRVEFYHQGSVDALKIALDMVKSIDSENKLLDGSGNDDAL